jgi:YhcH/YjgK/YiaL family protein
MLLDRLEDASRYAALHAGIAAGLEFLRQPGLDSLPDGRHGILGEQLFALVARQQGRGRDPSPLEFHRQYIDIQYVVAGHESIGWLPTADGRRIAIPYDPQRDIGFFRDRPETWLALSAGMFAVFFPEDAHAPLAGDGPVHKVVLKVRVRW